MKLTLHLSTRFLNTMNFEYIQALALANKYGHIIKIVRENIHLWSLDDFHKVYLLLFGIKRQWRRPRLVFEYFSEECIMYINKYIPQHIHEYLVTNDKKLDIWHTGKFFKYLKDCKNNTIVRNLPLMHDSQRLYKTTRSIYDEKLYDNNALHVYNNIAKFKFNMYRMKIATNIYETGMPLLYRINCQLDMCMHNNDRVYSVNVYYKTISQEMKLTYLNNIQNGNSIYDYVTTCACLRRDEYKCWYRKYYNIHRLYSMAL